MKIFKDNNLNDKFREFGFIKIKLFNKSETNAIKKTAKKIIKTENLDDNILNYVPNKNTSDKTALEINSFFLDIMKNKTSSIFESDYEFFNSFFFIKKKKSEALPWHSDTTMYDQKKYNRPFTIWSGINKTSQNNGCFRVIPKSHKLAFDYETYPICNMHKSNKVYSLYNSLIEKYAIDVPLDNGEVIIHDQSLIHASYANSSFFKKRIAFKLLFIPKNINTFKMCFQNPSVINSEYQFYSLNKDKLKINSSKYFSKEHSAYDKNTLLKTINFDPSFFPFTSLSDMERIMNNPIDSLKSKFEIAPIKK